jgi:hypothetical protein
MTFRNVGTHTQGFTQVMTNPFCIRIQSVPPPHLTLTQPWIATVLNRVVVGWYICILRNIERKRHSKSRRIYQLSKLEPGVCLKDYSQA